MNSRLKKRLEALEKAIPPPRDLSQEILIRALATALSPEELQMLRDSANADEVIQIPPELMTRIREAAEAVTMDLTGRPLSKF